MLSATFAALTYLTDLGEKETINSIIQERILQRIQWRVFPVEEFGSNTLDGPMHIVSSLLGSGHFSISDVDPGLVPAIFKVLR
jgi:hypothetical protein